MNLEISVSEENGLAWLGVSAQAAPVTDIPFWNALMKAFDEIETSTTAKCVVISGAPKGFPRGFANTDLVDMSVYETGRNALARIESFRLPVVAVIPDGAINEGLELAMAAHYRVAAQNARFGLSQISTGMIPVMGGTQRLPRLTGAKVALEMLLNGKLMTAQDAQEVGLVDHVTGRDFAKDVMAYLNDLVAGNSSPRPTKDMVSGRAAPERYQAQMNEARDMVAAYSGPAAHAIVDCVEAAQLMPLPIGMTVERSKFDVCRNSQESHALRHVAIAEQRLMRPGPRSASAVNVLVIGAKDQDAGLCVALLDAGLNLTVLEQNGPPHPSMSGSIISIYDKAVQLGRMRAEVRASRVARLDVVHEADGLAAADVVVDAGDLSAAQVLDFMRAYSSEDTQIFLTARSGQKAEELAGLISDICPVTAFAFPREPHMTKVVEVYALPAQPPTVSQDACEFFRVAKRMPILVEEGQFRLAAQLRAILMEAAETLLLHGAEPRQIDGAMVNFGFRLGPLAMRDEVGMAADLVAGSQPATEALLASGRKGRATGLGYFRYGKGDPRPRADGVVVWSLSGTRERLGITPIEFSQDEITKLILGALVNLGAVLVDGDVIQRASDIDVLSIHSINFPRRRGGPMQAAEALGLFDVLQVMDRHAALNAKLWTPHMLVRELVKYGQGFENMDLPDLDHAS